MRIYLDEDCASRYLIRALTGGGHDVQSPRDVGQLGKDDAVQFLHAIEDDRLIVTGNHDDFENLHNLVIRSGGRHPGIATIRRGHDRRKTMTPPQITVAIARLAAANIPLRNQLVVLNNWR